MMVNTGWMTTTTLKIIFLIYLSDAVKLNGNYHTKVHIISFTSYIYVTLSGMVYTVQSWRHRVINHCDRRMHHSS